MRPRPHIRFQSKEVYMTELKADETLEDLQLKSLKIIQKKNGFRFGMEAVLLADFAGIGPGDQTADLGCGNGILPLLLYGRGKGSRYCGFEIQKEAAELAERNAALNGMEDVFRVFNADIMEAPDLLEDSRVDAVICNPPWEEPGRGTINSSLSLSTARHQGENALDSFLHTAYKILKRRGRIFLVYPAGGILTLFTSLRKHRLEPKSYRMVYPTLKHPARMVLTEAVRDGKPGLVSMKPLIIRNLNGDLTNELKSIYHIAE